MDGDRRKERWIADGGEDINRFHEPRASAARERVGVERPVRAIPEALPVVPGEKMPCFLRGPAHVEATGGHADDLRLGSRQVLDGDPAGVSAGCR